MGDRPVKKMDTSAAARAAMISNILSADTGFSHKLAIAMAGTSEPFVMGHGSGGTGACKKGKCIGAYGRIHGLGSASLEEGSAFSKKLALAMAGTGTEFVIGHGSDKKVDRFGDTEKAKQTCMERCLKACGQK